MTTEQNLAETIGIPISIKQMPVNGHTINYVVAGSGSPLILIHPANIGWGSWYPNIAEFAQYFTVYAIDLPGAGRSSPIDYALLDPEKDFLKTVEAFIDSLNLQNINIIGSSMGGWIALRYALQHPERVGKIIVADGVGFSSSASLPDKIIGFYPLANLIIKTLLRPGGKGVEGFLRGVFYNKNVHLPREFIDYFYETTERSHGFLLISRLNALHRKLSLAKDLPRIRTKTLIVWGEKDGILPVERSRENFFLVPDAEVRTMNATGHMPSIENKEEFNAMALSFLKQ